MILQNIKKVYKVNNKEIYALNNINLSIDENKGGFYVIKGHSGSGKTTLIQIIGLLNDADDGIYKIDEIDVKTMGERKKANLRSEKFGFIFQSYHLMEHLKAYENVMIPMLLNKNIEKNKRKSEAIDLLEKVGLGDRVDHFPKELSGGEQQRVAIARALVNNPDIILADEPTGNLDEESEKLIFELLKKISLNKCVIVVSHNNTIDSYADKIYYMEGGKITCEK